VAPETPALIWFLWSVKVLDLDLNALGDLDFDFGWAF